MDWFEVMKKEVKKSTLEDYKYSMNRYILPRFGNDPMSEIGYLEIRKFVSELACSHKRKNNVLVPMRSVLKMAFLNGDIDQNGSFDFGDINPFVTLLSQPHKSLISVEPTDELRCWGC